ncbi:MAG: substrate-binding domain-containing protein [Erythrobacter sp.]|uniref:PstS family phosphate ABC transporter substrate-binding protein n=1 Tax=Erythrobacter sp. TaxID=1042 RepID=UPI0026325F5D|nr:substrate-binding domain-containing protein [Erythrobacter sp.]MDJ0978259.1 substrate-binding domain-containing protein [Erythrobacter sp.]
MINTSQSKARFASALLAGAACLSLGACAEEAEEIIETVTVVGSSTVYPFAQKVAEDAVAANEGLAAPDISSTGSSEGIAEFCKGQGPDTVDIVNASRRMTLDEFNACQSAGVSDIIEIKVGRDGIVFAAAIEKGFDFGLTPATVYRALSASPFGEEQTSANWSDVAGGLPDEPIIVYGPSETSGTRDALLDVIMMPVCTANAAMVALEESDPEAFETNCHALRNDSAYVDQGEKDELVVSKIANNPSAIGIFGYSYLEENADRIRGLTLGGVAPNAETIADGSYPGSRPLYLYVKKAHIGVTPGIEEYLAQWAKSWSADGPLTQIGLVPATGEVQEKSAAAIANSTALTQADFEEAAE